MLNKFKTLILLLLFPVLLQANQEIDSLENILPNCTDTTKVNVLKELCWLYASVNTDKALEYGEQALELATDIKFQKGMSKAYGNLAVVYYYRGDISKSTNYFLNRIDIEKKLGRKGEMAATYNNLGTIYYYQGMYPKALETYLNAIQIYDEIGIDSKTMGILHNVGLLYQGMDEDSVALEYYDKSYKLYIKYDNKTGGENYNHKTGLATVLSNMGTIHTKNNEYDSANVYFEKALKIAKDIDNKNLLGTTYLLLAELHIEKREYNMALVNCNEAVRIIKELGNKSKLAKSYQVLATIYYEIKDFDNAKKYGKESYKISIELSELRTIKDASEVLFKIYKATRDFKKALNYQTVYLTFKDSIFNQEKNKAINSLQVGYELEKAMAKNKFLEVKQAERAKRQKIYYLAGFIVFILLFVIAIVLLRSNNQKKKANEILHAQNDQIELQKNVIEQKNHDITASITYAERIQNAILPKIETIQQDLPKSFVLFKPRDIVSGDFYWYTKAKDGKLIIAAVDCTGHGVPGAFMSFIGSDWLDRIVNTQGITKADKILTELDQGINDALKQNETQNKDGMDIALCVIDKKKNELEFAGANNPLVYVQNSELQIVKGKNRSIGGGDLERKKEMVGDFESHIISMKDPVTCYLFSDGFQDQFGGSKGKKFMRKRLYEMLYNNHQMTMDDQKKDLVTTIEEWMRDFEQIDDIIILGFQP